jgi:hypothetical protein
LQIPFHHKRNVEKLQDYIFESKVDMLACVGDEVDVPQLGCLIKVLEQSLNALYKEILTQLTMCLQISGKPWIKEKTIYLTTQQP